MALNKQMNPIDHEKQLTEQDWAAFISTEIQSTCEAYLKKPAFLLGHSRSENQTKADYAGRELLELVQNAADAASEKGRPGRVLIEVTQDALYVANTGLTFRKSGVKSLMTAHTSDKPTRAAQMIGAKGLGFRAILNWTDAPIICSGALEIGFSPTHARSLVVELARQNAEIAENFWADHTNSPPLLMFPATGAELNALNESGTQTVMQYARKLRSDGYDTVIVAPLSSTKARERAIEQAGHFEPSFLLFVRTLEEIRIRLPGCDEKSWRKEVSDNGDLSLQLKYGSESNTQEWIVRQKVGSIGDGEDGRKFEIAIAIRCDETNKPDKLYSFFPTSLPLPFPALFHATLELDSNRKTINEHSQHNGEVLKALGRFHAETVAELRQSGRISKPLEFLVAHQDFPDALKSVSDAAWLKARDLPIIQCMDRIWRNANDARIGPVRYTEYLPVRRFGRLARINSADIEELLRYEFKVPTVSNKEIIDTLRRANLSFSERAKAIVGLAKAFPDDEHDRRLLIDTKGKEIPSTATAFPLPADKAKRFEIPGWANARFIHPKLWSELLAEAPGNAVRNKIYLLKGFQIVEYSAEAVIAALRSRVIDLLRKNRSNPDNLQASFLSTIYSLHDRTRNRPQGVFRVRCKDGQWRDITTVHLSEHYGKVGRTTAALFAGDPELLIGTPQENGLISDTNDLPEFLGWLGINPWPRKVNEPLPENWRQSVLDALPERIQVTDGNTSREIIRSDLIWGHTVSATHDTVYALDRVLSDAPTEAILAWLAHDPRLDPLAPTPNFSIRLEARENGYSKFRAYQGALPNTVQLDIQTKPWLQCQEGQRRAPRDLMLEPGVLSALFHAPRALSSSGEVEFGLDKAHWRRGLERAGVVRNLDDLPEPQVYRLLSSLPSRQVRPEVGSRLFLQILERESFNPELGGSDGIAFRNSGKLPIQLAGQRVWAAREGVLYAQRDDFPSITKSHLRLLDLPTRRNATQVLARFGIPTLQKSSLSLKIFAVEEVVEGNSTTLRSRFNRSKPYISALRKALSPDGTQLRRLEALQLKVVCRAEVEFTIDGNKNVEELDPWRHIFDNDTMIVTIDESATFEEIISLGCHTIADGLAELFQLQSGTDFMPFLASSTEGLCRAHLQRALPSLPEDELTLLMNGIDQAFVSPFAPDVDSETLAAGPAPASTKSRETPTSSITDSDKKVKESTSNEDSTKIKNSEFKLTIQQRQKQNKESKERATVSRRTLRVTGPTSPLPDSTESDPLRAADAESWTAAFEHASGRCPLSVSYLQGSRAFGCDYLSFETKEHRTTFLKNPDRIDLVNRFIETKSGRVLFSDNEWIAVNKLGERYFVYRIIFNEGRRNQAQLTIAQNPTAFGEAIHTVRELLIDNFANREEFDLIASSKD